MGCENVAGRMLAYFELGCIGSQIVVDWADSQIAAWDQEADIPVWFLDLSMHGPEPFLRRWTAGPYEWPRVVALSYRERFRALVEYCDPNDASAVERFQDWCARNSPFDTCDRDLDEWRAVSEIYYCGGLYGHDLHQVAVDALRRFRPECRDVAEFLATQGICTAAKVLR